MEFSRCARPGSAWFALSESTSASPSKLNSVSSTNPREPQQAKPAW
jgi:hypothetical protein